MTEPQPPLIQTESVGATSSPRMTRLRNYFLTGLVVAGPVAITIWLTHWLIALIDDTVKPLIPRTYNPETYLPFAVPGLGVVVAIIALTLLGFLTANILGRTIVNTGETLLNRMPVVRSLYAGTKQIFETVFRQGSTSFRQVGLIEWPGPGLWSIVFVTEGVKGEMAEKLGPGHVCVFIPTTPPTTGYLVMMERSKIIDVNLTTDEAFKLVMSVGIIQPEDRAKALMTETPPKKRTRKSAATEKAGPAG